MIGTGHPAEQIRSLSLLRTGELYFAMLSAVDPRQVKQLIDVNAICGDQIGKW
jgi:hypothetical protein